MRTSWFLGALLPLAAAGCAGLESTVKTRAAQDFRCSEERLKIVDRESTVFRVAGCGSEATYVCKEGRNLRTTCQQAEWESKAQL